ncbi:uncharacterized protein JCM15063_001197 [Sporobolomyces koalae]|uniref:uncharacterized protein n=1 Tax=Sporobolomyces koalae TaxID=500713 RepID=UPI003170E41A
MQCHCRISTFSTKPFNRRHSAEPNGQPSSPAREPSTPTPSLASLLASLQAATSNSRTAPDTAGEIDEGADLSEADLERMLEKLDEAEGAADDLEGKLDGLISNLDQMLGLLGVDPSDLENAQETEDEQHQDR